MGLTSVQDGALSTVRQLLGNIDEVTDVRFVGSRASPTHLAVSTNSEAVRLFDASTLSCTATLAGHIGIVLCLDSVLLSDGRSMLASSSKDNSVRVWSVPDGRCIGANRLQSIRAHEAVNAVWFAHWLNFIHLCCCV